MDMICVFVVMENVFHQKVLGNNQQTTNYIQVF